jgi:hypothetical protein
VGFPGRQPFSAYPGVDGFPEGGWMERRFDLLALIAVLVSAFALIVLAAVLYTAVAVPEAAFG